jgi:hypothetical protein
MFQKEKTMKHERRKTGTVMEGTIFNTDDRNTHGSEKVL